MVKKQVIVGKYGTSQAQGSKKMLWVMIFIVGFFLSLNFVSAIDWKTGLEGYYKMDNITGTNIEREEVFGVRNGTLYNGLGYNTTTGKIGNASGTYDGTNDYISFATNHPEYYNFSVNQPFSISFWSYITDNSTEQHAISKSDNVHGFEVVIYAQKIYVEFDSTLTVNTNKILSIGWNYIVLTYDGTNTSAGILVYHNGYSKSLSTSGTMGEITNLNNFTIGSFSQGINYPLKGLIDEVGIWNRSLSSSEISDLWNYGAGTSYPGNLLYTENSQTYNPSTVTKTSETFIINITYNATLYTAISANFFYNGTGYTGIKYGSGNTIEYKKTIIIPQISTTSNYTFYWQFNFTNSTGNYIYNLTSHNQTIYIVGIDNCGTYSILLINFTLFDEKTQSKITADINTSIETNLELYPSNSNDIILNYSVGVNKSNLSICISTYLSNDTSYRLYGLTKYYSSNYITEYHYFQNYTLTNSSIPQHIKLYDLKTSESTEFLITYYDINYITLEDAIVIINRKYIAEGTFKPVEWIKTDNFGHGKGHFDLSAIYLINVYKEGELLSAFTNLAISCENIVTGDCRINLFASAVEDILVDYYIYHNLYYDMKFNMTTRTVTSNFQTVDSSSVTMNLNLTKFDGYGNFSLCSNTVVGSAGTLTCTIPASQTNVTFIAEIKKDGELITTAVYKIYPTTISIFGDNSVIFVLGMVITIPLMFIPSMYGILIGAGIGFIFGIELLNLSPNMFGGAAFLTWLIIVILIIIWKVQNRRAE